MPPFYNEILSLFMVSLPNQPKDLHGQVFFGWHTFPAQREGVVLLLAFFNRQSKIGNRKLESPFRQHA
jgi:hypothetical protein